jgi:hypothetical protein
LRPELRGFPSKPEQALTFLQSLRSLFKGTGSAAPSADLSFGLIDKLGIKPLLEQRQWLAFEKLATDLPPDELTRLLDGLCLSEHHAALLVYYQQSGDSEMRRLVAAVYATFRAWEARSGAYARELSQQQVDGFTHYLTQAHAHLAPPFAEPALQAQASARLVRVAMGLSEPELAQVAYAQCVALQPSHLLAHLFYFNVLTPKWFGDEEVLEDFVTIGSGAALRDLLQAMYLVELQFIVDDSTALAKADFKNANQCRIAELLAKKPLAEDSLYAIYFNNYLACLSHNLGELAQRDHFLQALAGRVTAYPWAYFGLAPQVVRKLSHP